MAELTATVAEARAHFSKIASSVCATGKPVTVIRNSKPWVTIAPASPEHLPVIDWAAPDVVRIDPVTRKTVLPADWDDPEDEGLYDDLV